MSGRLWNAPLVALVACLPSAAYPQLGEVHLGSVVSYGGAASYGLGAGLVLGVAAGRLDGYFERPVQAWDMAAGILIAREAGGRVTALEHDGFDVYTPEALVTNRMLHDQIRALILRTLGVAAP